MIDLTVAQIADIVGGELADISAEDAASLHVTGTVEFDSRGPTRRVVPRAAGGADRRPRPRRPRRWPPERSRCWPPDRSACPRSSWTPQLRTPHTARDPATGRRPRTRHRRLGRGGAGRAGASWPPRWPPSWSHGGLTIVGITGSSGKTSTKDLLAAVLAPLGTVIAPPGSFNNEIGHPWTALRATPPPTTSFWSCRRAIRATSPRSPR